VFSIGSSQLKDIIMKSKFKKCESEKKNPENKTENTEFDKKKQLYSPKKV